MTNLLILILGLSFNHSINNLKNMINYLMHKKDQEVLTQGYLCEQVFINYKDKNGKTTLHFAAEASKDTVELSLDCGVSSYVSQMFVNL